MDEGFKPTPVEPQILQYRNLYLEKDKPNQGFLNNDKLAGYSDFLSQKISKLPNSADLYRLTGDTLILQVEKDSIELLLLINRNSKNLNKIYPEIDKLMGQYIGRFTKSDWQVNALSYCNKVLENTKKMTQDSELCYCDIIGKEQIFLYRMFSVLSEADLTQGKTFFI
jgi:hypothetical protein